MTRGGESGVVVQLRAAGLPRPLGVLAVHHWFAVREPERAGWTRWEVWQDPDVGGTSWQHVHRDLTGVDSGVGGGAPWVEREWRGEEADRLRAVLEAPEAYPHRDRYLAWPGPNSNTYAAWALAQAGLEHEFERRAVGWNYRTGRRRFGLPIPLRRLRPRLRAQERQPRHRGRPGRDGPRRQG